MVSFESYCVSIFSYKFILRCKIWNIYLWRISCGVCHSAAQGAMERSSSKVNLTHRKIFHVMTELKGSIQLTHFTDEENESQSKGVISKSNTCICKLNGMMVRDEEDGKLTLFLAISANFSVSVPAVWELSLCRDSQSIFNETKLTNVT